jgi:hypothetical protein
MTQYELHVLRYHWFIFAPELPPFSTVNIVKKRAKMFAVCAWTKIAVNE